MTPQNRQIAIRETGEYVRNRIHDLREHQHLTFVELARRVGDEHNMTDQTVRRMEGGKRRIDVDDLSAIADALGVGMADLLPHPARSMSLGAVTPESVDGAVHSADQIFGQVMQKLENIGIVPKNS